MDPNGQKNTSIFRKIFRKIEDDSDGHDGKITVRRTSRCLRNRNIPTCTVAVVDIAKQRKDSQSTSSKELLNFASASYGQESGKSKGSLERVPKKKRPSQPRESVLLKAMKLKRNDNVSDGKPCEKNETDYQSLFDETEEACVNIESTEEASFDLFTKDDVLSGLVDETESSSPDLTEVKTKASKVKRFKMKQKPDQNSSIRYNYDCFKCRKRFRNRAPLNLHIAAEHNEDGGLGMICSECGKQVDYDHELGLHKKFFCKKVKKPFKCLNCQLSFITEIERDEHPCTRDVAKPYYCIMQDCQTSCRNVKDLTEHVTRHLGLKPFLCNICGRAFSAKKDMDRHSDIHKDSNDYVCQVCGQSFKSYHTLRRHVFVHKFKDRFKCDQCPYTTATKNAFNQHMIKHKQRTHKCSICDKNLRSAKSLAKHIQNRHTFNRIFTCRFCDFTTDVGLSYSSHMRSHKGFKDIDHSNGIPGELSEQEVNNSQLNNLPPNENLQEMMSTKFHAGLSLNDTSTDLSRDRDRTVLPMLADVAALDHEDIHVDITGQNAIIANMVDVTDTSAMISVESSNANMVLYSMGVPASSLQVSGFMSDPTAVVTDIVENWTDTVT